MAKRMGENAKVAVISAAITAIGAVVVAAIGVLPTIRDKSDRINALENRRDELEKQVKELKNQVLELSPPYALRGSVRSTADNRPITDAELYIANPDNQATLDDNGAFVVKNTFRRAYWLVVARPNGKILRLLINPSDPVGEAAGVAIRYTFDRE